MCFFFVFCGFEGLKVTELKIDSIGFKVKGLGPKFRV